MLLDFFSHLAKTLNNPLFLFLALCIAIPLKVYVFSFLVRTHLATKKTSFLRCLLLLILAGAIISDSAWLLRVIRIVFLPTIEYRLTIFWNRIAWSFAAIQYQAFALFLTKLSSETESLNKKSKFFIAITSLFVVFFIALSIFHFNCFHDSERTALECQVLNYFCFYGMLILMPSSIIITLYNLQKKHIPLLLRKQIRILISFMVIPWLITEIIQVYPIAFLPGFVTTSYALVGISTILLATAIYLCSRRMSSLRFLNLQTQVQTITKFNFIDGFKDILSQLSHTTNVQELGHITQNLFKSAFDIPMNKTTLYIRKTNAITTQESISQSPDSNRIADLTEIFIATCGPEIATYIAHAKILVYDEITFSNFYEKSDAQQTIITFLDSIDADIFVPIYEKHKLIAYIIVERKSRAKFYGNVEQNEMLVFASYLSNIINLLQHRNLKALIHQEKELKEELYLKHQEINQYKESIRSFLRSTNQKEIGIIFYKNRRFVFGNKAAKDLIPFNINAQEGHPIAKALKNIASQVGEYNTPCTNIVHDLVHGKLVLAGVPNLENNTIIITVYRPEVADVIKQQIDQLKDPTMWDYLLYLETTRSGQLINQLIPGNGETLLNFKIELLKTALSKKATLLELPEEDLIATVELLHHISLRETLHILTLHDPCRTNDTAIKLFGMNQLFTTTPETKPLLEQLDGTGTLFIQNIHFLDLETQEYLAEFINYGFFKPIKSEQKMPSNVRIICSTNQNLQTLAHEGGFSKALLNELKKTTLCMPSLLTLSQEELSNLANGLAEQVVQTNDLKSLFELTEKERLKLAATRPVSLQELKKKIQILLTSKSKKKNLQDDMQFDPAAQITDPQLIDAARLGKKALRDPKIMSMLWYKFKNQNTIALFLGVNRSSVNRRCKDYNLE